MVKIKQNIELPTPKQNSFRKNTFSGIYKIQSICKPERIYIGSAVNINKRWGEHFSYLKTNKHNPKLQNHCNKYGKSDLVFSVLSGCDPEDLIQQEQFYIDSFKPYFNIRLKAESNLGIKQTEEALIKKRAFRHSEESKRKISKVHKGKIVSAKTRRKISEGNKGKILSVEHRQNISEGKRGKKRKPHSAKTRRKMSEAKIGRIFSDEHKRNLSKANKLVWDNRKKVLVND